MPDIETEFRDEEEMKALRWAAAQAGMTVEEFTAYAANKFVEKTKSDIRKRITNPQGMKKLK